MDAYKLCAVFLICSMVWALLPNDFVHGTPDSELTPTLKLKRNVVIAKYATVIKELYGDEHRQSRL